MRTVINGAAIRTTTDGPRRTMGSRLWRRLAPPVRPRSQAPQSTFKTLARKTGPRRVLSREVLPTAIWAEQRPVDRTSGNLARAGFGATAGQVSAAEYAMLQERARIARDLHDSVSQTLYAITLSAARARRLLQDNEANKAQDILGDVLLLATAGQSELRALLSDIRTDLLPSAGLIGGLAHLAADVRTRNGLDVRVSVADEPGLPVDMRQALVLICREALHNVVNHAGADRVDVVLEVLAEEVLLLIKDNGRGFDLAASRPGHFGLQSMRERATAVGGTLELISLRAVGTEVRVRIARATGA